MICRLFGEVLLTREFAYLLSFAKINKENQNQITKKKNNADFTPNKVVELFSTKIHR